MVGDDDLPETNHNKRLPGTETEKFIEEKQSSVLVGVSHIRDAARWLHDHRDDIVGPVIPALKTRFGLRNLEAIEATKQAHALAYPKVM